MTCNQCKHTFKELKSLRDKLNYVDIGLESSKASLLYDTVYEHLSEIIRSLQFEIDIKSIAKETP